MVWYASGWDFTDPGTNTLWIWWINGCPSYTRRFKTHKSQRFCDLWICKGSADSRRGVRLVSLGMVVKLWSVRAAVYSELPRETEVGYGIRGGLWGGIYRTEKRQMQGHFLWVN